MTSAVAVAVVLVILGREPSPARTSPFAQVLLAVAVSGRARGAGRVPVAEVAEVAEGFAS